MRDDGCVGNGCQGEGEKLSKLNLISRIIDIFELNRPSCKKQTQHRKLATCEPHNCVTVAPQANIYSDRGGVGAIPGKPSAVNGGGGSSKGKGGKRCT